MAGHPSAGCAAGSTKWQRFKALLLTTALGWIPYKPGIGLRSLAYRSLLHHLGQSVWIDRSVALYQPDRISLGDRLYLGQDVCLDADGENNSIEIEADSYLGSRVRLSCKANNSRIVLHQQVSLDRGAEICPLENGLVEIGEATYIGPSVCIAGPGTIKIGRNCMIVAHTGIYATNHNFDDLNHPIAGQRMTPNGIVIEDDCWLGRGVKVLDGVTIGRGSVIGAGAVVTENIPPYSVAMGAPAKVISQQDGALAHNKPLVHNKPPSLVIACRSLAQIDQSNSPREASF